MATKDKDLKVSKPYSMRPSWIAWVRKERARLEKKEGCYISESEVVERALVFYAAYAVNNVTIKYDADVTESVLRKARKE